MIVRSLKSDPHEWVDGKLPQAGDVVEMVVVQVDEQPLGLSDQEAVVTIQYRIKSSKSK